jgi:hypothetical protein
MNNFDEINRIAQETNTTDYCIHSYENDDLLILGSFDFSYYHQVEVLFENVKYFDIATWFSYPYFRQATSKEMKNIRSQNLIEAEDKVFCIEAETENSMDRTAFFIVAEKMTVRPGMVYYYERKNLKEGERIADWV